MSTTMNAVSRSQQKIKNRNIRSLIIRYFVLILVGGIMIYPLLWMIGASFKSNAEIFTTINPIPMNPTTDGYVNAVKNYTGNINIWKALLNTYKYVIPQVIFTVISCTLTAYGFSRFHFKGRNLMFTCMLAMLFLPQVVLNVPQYMMYNSWGWVGSSLYLPLWVPSMFATESYFVFMLVQFLRNIPRDLDEAAKIDGCNSLQILTKIIAPMLLPAIVSVALFKFMWSSNDFMGPLLYVKKPDLKPATLFVKSFIDSDSGFDWNVVLAVSLISILPNIIIFFLAQNQFVDGITAGGVKG